MEVGSGTGYYLAQIVEAAPKSLALAVDLSKYAARRAARAHARVGSLVCDVWDGLPVADGAIGLIVNIFAPRQPKELYRTLHRNGMLLVVAPRQDHLVELRGVLGLLTIDPDKESRIARGFEPYFQLVAKEPLVWPTRLTKADVAALVGMGPSARHLVPTTLSARIARLPDQMTVTAAVTIHIYRSRQYKPGSLE